MKNQAIKSTDDLILGIRNIISNDRCSFTVEEKDLLEDCIIRLERTKNYSSSDPIITEEKLKVLTRLIRFFSIAKHLFDLFID